MDNTKFKVGDKVRIIKNLHGHHFPIGSIQEIERVTVFNYQVGKSGGDAWYCQDDELELDTEMAILETPKNTKGSPMDIQIAGNHYKMPIQPTEFIQKNGINWCEGNVIKYVSRHAKKNGLEDLRKAQHYLEMLIEMEYGDKDE